jgi:lysophospholipase L1-like esterase
MSIASRGKRGLDVPLVRPRRHVLYQALGIVSVGGLLYAAVDLGYGVFFPRKPYDGYQERLTAPAYAGERYFSETFLSESFTQPGGWHTQAGTRLVFPNEFHGQYFNVDLLQPTGLPYRRTVGPAHPSLRPLVLLLGGSTIYDSEVPDGYTVASLLAEILNKSEGGPYTVINAGVTSANTAQEAERLEMELRRGLRPTFVVSYSGVNDALQGVYFGDPDGVMFSDANRSRGPHPRQSAVRDLLQTHLPPWLFNAGRAVVTYRPTRIYQALVLRSRYRRPRVVPQHLDDPVRVEDLAVRTAQRYQEHLVQMHRQGNLWGFRFLAMLQPQIYSGRDYRERADVTFVEQFDAIRLPKVEAAFDASYRELQKALPRAQHEGVRTFDLTRLFDGKTENVFLDSHHVNARGNLYIAKAIAGALATVDGTPSP